MNKINLQIKFFYDYLKDCLSCDLVDNIFEKYILLLVSYPVVSFFYFRLEQISYMLCHLTFGPNPSISQNK